LAASAKISILVPPKSTPNRKSVSMRLYRGLGLVAQAGGGAAEWGMDHLLDVKGLACPLPVLRANRELRGLAPGAKLRVLATDRAAVADFRAYCRETGHDLLAFSEEAGVFSFTIRRRVEKAPAP
jgi:tRNA 2-thiouridine synthesizing protein A